MRDLYFSQNQDHPHKWLFCCVMKRRVTGIGYTNLVNSLRQKHSIEYSVALEEAVTQSSSHDSNASHEGKSETFLWKPWTAGVHFWLQQILHNLFPFRASQNQNVQSHVKYEAISINSFTKFGGLLTNYVKKTVASALPGKFALDIYGWTDAESYCLCV